MRYPGGKRGQLAYHTIPVVLRSESQTWEQEEALGRQLWEWGVRSLPTVASSSRSFLHKRMPESLSPSHYPSSSRAEHLTSFPQAAPFASINHVFSFISPNISREKKLPCIKRSTPGLTYISNRDVLDGTLPKWSRSHYYLLVLLSTFISHSISLKQKNKAGHGTSCPESQDLGGHSGRNSSRSPSAIS